MDLLYLVHWSVSPPKIKNFPPVQNIIYNCSVLCHKLKRKLNKNVFFINVIVEWRSIIKTSTGNIYSVPEIISIRLCRYHLRKYF